ncbi:MAG: cytochrome c-type biogenesis protein CcmH [Magnetovibrio sp.]|nr:cytochrome c-type biogenesis protein CcmH [Magnetovibrio sp.]
MTLKALVFMLAVAVFTPTIVFAIEPSEVLSDPLLEARARVVGKGLRCVVCQNQSIDESNADLARDMRVLVRARITRGDTNEQVMAYMVDRYGDFVLMNPPLKASTVVLWFGPAVIAGLGLFAVFSFYRRRNEEEAETKASNVTNAQDAPLSAAERSSLKALMKEDNV